jgi:hypothetical protein
MLVIRIAKRIAPKTKFRRRLLRRWANANAVMAQISAKRRFLGAFVPGDAGLLRKFGTDCDAAVEMNVSVACAVPLAGTVTALRVQVISSVEEVPQVFDERLGEPVRPPVLVKVRVVEADWPGAVIVNNPGLAVTPNEGGAVTVCVIVADSNRSSWSLRCKRPGVGPSRREGLMWWSGPAHLKPARSPRLNYSIRTGLSRLSLGPRFARQ